MGRFTWTQGHQKQPSDKSQALPDWFSKSSGEPSRQALTELIKEHSPPGSTRTRSRTNTVSSKLSRDAQSSSDQSSLEPSTRSPSRSSIMDESHFSPHRQERMSKHFLSKGTRMMRRQTSRFNMLANSEDSRAAGLARVRSAGHLLNLHTKRSDPRPQISGPFGFQHVSHTDQSQYQSLNRTDPSNLADSFTALQADQEPGQEIKGIPVADLPSATPTGDQTQVSPPHSPTFSIVPSLPSTPPKSAPPPKDLHLRLPSLGGDIRVSRSMENFSWPTRSPQLDSGDPIRNETSFVPTQNESVQQNSALPSPTRLHVVQSATSASAPASPRLLPPVTTELLDKPLPQPPTVVHAVSTGDDATLMMKVAPLPQVPQATPPMDGVAKAENSGSSPTFQSPSNRSQARQSSRISRRRSQSSSDIPLASTLGALAAVKSTPPRPARQSKRISVGIKKIDIDDWEDAIDYSWDHAFDGDDDLQQIPEAMTKSDVLPQRACAFIPQRMSSARQSNSLAPFPGLPVRTTKSEVNLQGLGINSMRPDSDSFAAAEYEEYSEKHESLKVPFVRREPGSPISKSSSQESIILSIASSIMSTHRSSNSSTSLGDLESIKDEDTLPHDDNVKLVSGSGSVSSSETVTTDTKSAPTTDSQSKEDTLEELPTTMHQRGTSATRLPFVRSSAAPTKGATRQRSSTQSSGRKLNSRASYSLFPTAPSTTSTN